MKLFISGGAGFIGTNVALLALSRGHEVVAFDNLARSDVTENLNLLRTKKKFTFIHGDIRNARDFETLPSDIDCIINFAANPSVPKSLERPRYDFDINVVGHLNILDYAVHNGNIPVILASSNKVYTDNINSLPLAKISTRYVLTDPALRNGIPESTDVDGNDGHTNSPYGVAKLAAEKYTREYWKHYKLPMAINRMSCIFGQYQKGVEEQGWVDWFLRAKKSGLPLVIYGDGLQVRDLLFGADVAELYLYEAEHMHKVNGGTFNVGGGMHEGFHTSLLELIKLIDTEFPGKKLRYTFKPWRDSDQKIYISDIRRVTKATGWKPTTKILEGLKKMWKAY